MNNYLGILNTDNMNKDGFVFPIDVLEQSMYEGALDGMPSLLNHDFHQPIGWIFPFGLYFEPSITKAIGNFWVVENEDDQKIINQKVENFQLELHYNHCKDHLEDFKKLLGAHYSNEGTFYSDSCVTYHDKEILLKVFPQFSDLKDKDGLISLNDILKQFEYVGSGTFKHRANDFAIFCHPFFRRSLSHFNNYNTYFIDEFIALNGKEGLNLRIALNSDAVGLSTTFSGQFEFDWWWGPKFDEDISNLKNEVTRYECNEREKIFSGVTGTEGNTNNGCW